MALRLVVKHSSGLRQIFGLFEGGELHPFVDQQDTLYLPSKVMPRYVLYEESIEKPEAPSLSMMAKAWKFFVRWKEAT